MMNAAFNIALEKALPDEIRAFREVAADTYNLREAPKKQGSGHLVPNPGHLVLNRVAAPKNPGPNVRAPSPSKATSTGRPSSRP